MSAHLINQGIYASSKAAILNLSETIRLELSPFRVSVLTIMAGTVESLFHANEVEVTLPSSSYYTAAREVISKLATGEVGPRSTSLQSFAQMVVEDIEKRDGVVWRGANSSIVYWFSKFSPGWLVVGH
jgi:short-subunit dehydrogenase